MNVKERQILVERILLREGRIPIERARRVAADIVSALEVMDELEHTNGRLDS